MSDNLEEEWTAISVDDIALFHTDQNVSAACPCCQNAGWDVAIGLDSNSGERETAVIFPSLHLANTSNLTPVNRSLPLFALTCQKCGYVRFHDMRLIQKWKRSKSEGAANNG